MTASWRMTRDRLDVERGQPAIQGRRSAVLVGGIRRGRHIPGGGVEVVSGKRVLDGKVDLARRVVPR